MPQGPLGASRPATDSTLLLVIKEIPVPDSGNKGVFPEKIIRQSDTEQAIVEDIAATSPFNTEDISVDRTSKMKRGFGQTDTYNIRIDVSGGTPQTVNETVERLANSGYVFNRTQFE